MDEYGYSYPPPFPPMRPAARDYPDHGDGFGEYYELGPLNKQSGKRRSRSKHRLGRNKDAKRSRSRSSSVSKSRSSSKSRTRARSRDRSRSKSGTETHSRSRSHSRRRDIDFKDPGFLDTFRVLYLTPRRNKKNSPKYLATRKRQDRIQELLKSDGLGSKRWLFYPRKRTCNELQGTTVSECKDSCDQRIKVDGDFFRKYKRSKKVDSDAPIAKLKRWELLLYKKLGFVHAVS